MIENIVYKYCKTKRVKSILIDSELHFSYPEELNDPEDSRVRVEFMGTPYVYLVREFAVLSLSEIRDSRNMWNKYADQQKGVCLGFRTSVFQETSCFVFDDKKLSVQSSPPGYLPLFKVKYSLDKLPAYQVPGGDPMRAFNFLVHKNPQWEYENEHRVIINKPQITSLGKLDVAFGTEILEEIIFGKQVTEEDKNEILSIIQDKYPAARLFMVSESSADVVKIISF